MSAIKSGSTKLPSDYGVFVTLKVNSDEELAQLEEKCVIVVETQKIVQEFVTKSNRSLESKSEECRLALENISDSGLILDGYNDNMLNYLFKQFDKYIVSMRRDDNNYKESSKAFETFLELIYFRRKYRIIEWIKENTKQFQLKEQINIIIAFVQETETLMKRILKPIVLCQSKCSKCNYLCLKHKSHSSDDHDCLGSHKCNKMCTYCTDHFNCGNIKFNIDHVDVLSCDLPSGHDGTHDCYVMFHACGKPCQVTDQCNGECEKKIDHPVTEECACGKKVHSCDKKCEFCEFEQDSKVFDCGNVLNHDGKHDCMMMGRDHQCSNDCRLVDKGNCKRQCIKKIGHSEWDDDDDGCICSSQIHYCNEPCSAPNCRDKCKINCNTKHKRHDCGMKKCLSKCQVKCRSDNDLTNEHYDQCGEECDRPCACDNHFHDLDMKSDERDSKFEEKIHETHHCCDHIHRCAARCSESGFCDHDMERIERKTFAGSQSEFEYDLTIKPKGIKHFCAIEIEKYQMKHDGKHICYDEEKQEKIIHKCDKACPACGYFCNKDYSHGGLHSTKHGSMINTKLS